MIGILLTGSLRSPPPIRAAPDFSTGKRVTRFSGRFAPLRIVFPCHPYAGGRTTCAYSRVTYQKIASRSFIVPLRRRRHRHIYDGAEGAVPPQWARSASQIGRPFYGQAKGQLWLTWRSYAGPPQYFIPPEGGALNPSGRRQPVPDRTLAAQGRKARRLAQPSRP